MSEKLLPCRFCKKLPGHRRGPPTLFRCMTEGCEGKSLSAKAVADWNVFNAPAQGTRDPDAWLIHWADVAAEFTRDVIQADLARKCCAQVEEFWGTPPVRSAAIGAEPASASLDYKSHVALREGGMMSRAGGEYHTIELKFLRLEDMQDARDGIVSLMTTKPFASPSQSTAMTAAPDGSVVVPAEVTDNMRYATWKAQALHVGATELEAIQMANRRMTPEQRAMDQAAYAAMLAAAPPATPTPSDAMTGGVWPNVHEYVAGYEYRGDQDYKPNENEQAMLEDAICGYIAEMNTPPSVAADQGVREALQVLLDHVDADTCRHEETKRGGSIWTICVECGRRWADDEGGFKPYCDAPAVAAARAALSRPAPDAAGSEWKDISPISPAEHRKGYLVTRPGNLPIRAYRTPGGDWFMHGASSVPLRGDFKPTHWQDLPEPPPIPRNDGHVGGTQS